MREVEPKDIEIKDFYMSAYPSDEAGAELCEGRTFGGLLECLHAGNCVYAYIGEDDSLIRHRLFEELAWLIDMPYEYIYDLWINKGEIK